MILVFGIAFFGSSAWADTVDLSALQWNPDPGMRLQHVDGHMIVTCVRQTGQNSWGMYYLNNGLWHSNTGYAVSNDGMAWTNVGIVMDNTPGGPDFDDTNAVICDVVALPNGALRAYCQGTTSNGPVWPWTSRIFTADSTDGVHWSNRQVIIDVMPGTPTAGGALGAKVIQRDGQYIMFFGSSTTDIVKATSADGLNWNICGVVIEHPSGGSLSDLGLDIAETPKGDLRMFIPTWLAGETGNSIRSLTSLDDGDTWTWDPGTRLSSDAYGVNRLNSCALADIDGTAKMFVSGGPGHPYDDVYSASAAPVPEPVSLASGAIGLAFVGAYLKRRGRK